MYSQRNEETYILGQLSGTTGNFLDIGAFHPKTFSNTRALYELGWKGIFIEPAPDLMILFKDEYGSDDGVQLIEKAIGDSCGKVAFQDSKGDAVGTVVKSHAELWRNNYGVPYEEIEVDMVDVNTLLELCMYKTFEFVNIDIEGLDLVVFTQFDFDKTATKCVCVEWNGNDKQAYIDHANKFSMSLIYESPENLIFAR